MQTVQEKEQVIIGTILNCNFEINKFLNESGANHVKGLKKFFESNSFDIYHYNMLNLYSQVTDIPLITLNESVQSLKDLPNAIQNSRNNYYAYFNKVYKFLNGYEVNIQKSLNESMNVDTLKVKNPIQLNIETFKDELKNIIQELSKQNDVENYSTEVLKIKTFANKPLFINGYNISNNVALVAELQKNFGLLAQNIIAICFNRNTKQLYFVPNNTNNIVVYDLLTDNLDLYNKINTPIPSEKLDGTNYLNVLKKLTGINNILEIYINPILLNLKFEDNLYHDVAYNNFRTKVSQQKLVVK
jgi:hypothetical protein